MNKPGTLRAEGMVSIMIDKPTRALLWKQATAMRLPLAYYVRKIAQMIDSDGQIPLSTDERLASPIDEIKAALEENNATVATQMAALEASYSDTELLICHIANAMGIKVLNTGLRTRFKKLMRSMPDNQIALMEEAGV